MVSGGETNDKCVLSDKQMLPGFNVNNKKIKIKKKGQGRKKSLTD
jgi:hypothetical protein